MPQLPVAERPRGVRVIIARTSAWQSHAALLEATLSHHERMRIERLRFAHDRVDRAIAYGLHRMALARELGVPAREVGLGRDDAGRPRVGRDEFWTSLSHAPGWVAIAIDRDAPVGIDVEPTARAAAVVEIADAVLHAEERTPCAPAESALDLLAVWVRKEAVLKAAGVGLQVAMDAFSVLDPGAVRIPGMNGQWRVYDVELDAPTRIAVATQGDVRIDCAVITPSRCHDAAVAFGSGS